MNAGDPRPWSLLFLLGLLCMGPAAAAHDQPPASDAEEASRRLETMRRSAAVYQLQAATEPPVSLEVREEPLLRWNNPVSGVKDGIIALWTDPAGRPWVVAQIFLSRDGVWIHEFQSIGPRPLTMSREGVRLWATSEGGVEMKPLPDAPAPAATAAARLAQMRGLARQFSAAVDFKTDFRDTKTTHYELRLLPRPLYRYAAERDEIRDGAIFAFVQGTNPEVFLLLETRTGDSGAQWFYGLAPMTGYRVEASHPSGVAWESRNKQADRHRNDLPYFITRYSE